MSPDLARIITIGSVILTAAGVGFAVLTAFRPTRIRIRRDLVMLAISAATILTFALVLRIRTPLPFIIAAVGLGLALGIGQGARLRIEERAGVFVARRDVLGLGAWGLGIAVAQVAGLASRTGAIELGQAVSVLGIATTATLVASRERDLARVRTLRAAGTVTAAIFPIPLLVGLALLQQQQPTPTPPPPITYAGEITWSGASDDFLNIGSLSDAVDLADARAKGFNLESRVVESSVNVAYDRAAGLVAMDGSLAIAWPLGEIQYMLELAFATIFDDVIDAKEKAAIDRAAGQRGCTATFRFTFASAPAPYAGGAFEAPVDIALAAPLSLSETDCVGLNDADDDDEVQITGQVLRITGLGTGAISGEVSGLWVFDDDDYVPQFTWPFEARADEPEEPDGKTPAPGASGNEDGTPVPPGDGEEPDDESASDDDAADGDDEVTEEEAAAGAVVGAIGAIATAAAAATAAGSGAAGASGGFAGGGQAGDGGGNGRRPGGPPTTGDSTGERLITNIRAAASSRGMDDVLDRLDRLGRNPDGTPNREALDRMKAIIDRRVGLTAWEEENAGLMQGTTAGDFARGVQKDVAGGLDRVAEAGDKFGRPELSIGGRIAAWGVRNPDAAAKIAVSVAVPPAGVAIGLVDVGAELVEKANTPGDESLEGAVKEVGWIAVREGGAELIGAGLGKALGAGARGLGEGAEELTTAAARQADDAAGAAARQADDVAGAAARQSDDAAAAAARESDDAASAAARESDDAASAAARESDDAASAAARESDDAGASAARQSGEPPDVPGAGTPAGRVDPTPLKNAPHGSRIAPEDINQAGWTRHEAEELQRVARVEGVVIGARTTNVDSLRHPTAHPKPLDVKGKTVNDADVALGAPDGNQGLSSMFEPKHPGADASPDLLKRFDERLKEYEKLSAKLPELEKKGIHWDKDSGLFTDAAGVPFRGDIDLVYLRDAKTGELLTGARYDEVVAKLQASGAKIQHGAEVNMVRDVTSAGGNVDTALKDVGVLSDRHVAGSEIVVETSATGFQKGATGLGMFDQLTGANPLSRGLPMEIP